MGIGDGLNMRCLPVFAYCCYDFFERENASILHHGLILQKAGIHCAASLDDVKRLRAAKRYKVQDTKSVQEVFRECKGDFIRTKCIKGKKIHVNQSEEVECSNFNHSNVSHSWKLMHLECI